MGIKEKLKQSMLLKIVLLVIVGIPLGLLMVDNDVVLSLGIILLFIVANKTEKSKKKSKKK